MLYTQIDSPGSTSVTSDDYFASSLDAYDDQAADDFTVPSGQSWQLLRVDVRGSFTGAPQSYMSVYLYSSAGGLPGDEIRRQIGTPASNGPNYSIPLTETPVLAPGTYWISVQQFDATASSYWKWGDRSGQSGSAAAFRQPGDGNSLGCTGWAPRPSCVSTTAAEPDQLFALLGNVGPYPPPGPPSTDFTIGRLRRNKVKGTARLTVVVPAAGTLELTGKGLVSQRPARASFGRAASRDVAGPGPVTLLIKATGKAKKKLDKTGKVTLHAVLTFTASDYGSPNSQTKTIILKKRLH